MAMGPWNCGGTGGPAKILVYLRRVQRSDIPILVDINVHYRMLKLLYTHNHFQLDFHCYLANLLILFGVWHTYKH